MNTLPPEKEGILVKRGHIRKNWKKRCFLLHGDGQLEYQTIGTVRCFFFFFISLKISFILTNLIHFRK